MDADLQRAELSEWYAESLRLTVFTLLPPASHDSWWQLGREFLVGETNRFIALQGVPGRLFRFATTRAVLSMPG